MTNRWEPLNAGAKPIITTPCHCNCVTFCPMHGYTQDESPYLFIEGWTRYGEPIWRAR